MNIYLAICAETHGGTGCIAVKQLWNRYGTVYICVEDLQDLLAYGAKKRLLNVCMMYKRKRCQSCKKQKVTVKIKLGVEK